MKVCCVPCIWVAIWLIASASSAAAGTIIHVPADQPTIQAAINVATNGDTVLVAPGTYAENVNFLGKAITVRSSNGAKATIIDGAQKDSVVTFNHSETSKSVLKGFTVQNGSAHEGGGISVENSSPTIANNTITHNGACNGSGIGVGFGSPIIRKNKIVFNIESTCEGLGGGGVSLRGPASAQILNNTISDNFMRGADGGGIALFAAGTPLIQGNLIRNNHSNLNGGGIVMSNQSDANIIENVITKNSASRGGGIYWQVPSGTRGPLLVNNTLVANDSSSTQGSEIFAGGFDINALVINTIIVGKSGQTAFFCDNINDLNPPGMRFNDVYNPSGSTYGGICTDPTGSNGNISADPLFTSHTNFRLMAGSPAIDVGDNSAPDLPAKDFAGHPRIVNGTVDLGAYEFIP